MPKFGRFTSLPKSGRVDVDVSLMPAAAARDACRLANQWPDTISGPDACTSGRFAVDRPRIYTPMPDSWDDHEALIKLGHEVLHRLGAEHA